MALEVFWGSGSGPAWRVLLTLAVKKAPYESRLLSFSKKEHKSNEILSMNPRGKVPVVRDGKFTLYESLAIMTYLDRRWPTPPLFGRTPDEAGEIMRVVMEHECYLGPAISTFTRPLLSGTLDEKRAETILAVAPLKEELGRFEEQLGRRAWLAGDALSAADIFVFPAMKALERATGKPGADALDHGLRPLSAGYPKLANWAAQIEALPGYEATYPPHWREG